jgi:hypothetical protein
MNSPRTFTVEVDGQPITVHVVYEVSTDPYWPDAYVCRFPDTPDNSGGDR